MSAYLQRRPGLRVGLLLTPPNQWLGVANLAALGALLLTSLRGQNAFTGDVERVFTLDNFKDLVTLDVYRTITLRTLGVALAVTVVDVVLAFPIAFFMAKVARPRARRLLVIAVLMPLWAAYLVKAYAWRGMFATGGLIDSVLGPIGLGSPGYGLTATVITLAYLWLPYMILPIYAGLERLPGSLLEASAATIQVSDQPVEPSSGRIVLTGAFSPSRTLVITCHVVPRTESPVSNAEISLR
jgi:putative spermidine/putrescine transport system permease protein